MTSDLWDQPMLDETSALDAALEYASAAAILRETVLLCAPTHQAKGVASQMAAACGVKAKTIHAAFLQPIFKASVMAAIAEFKDAYGATSFATQDRKDQAARALAFELKVRPEILVREYLENERNMAHTMGALNVPMLSFATHWELRDNAKSPLLAIVDETSMIAPRNVFDIAKACDAAIFLGDDCQLPPVAKKGDVSEAVNGVVAAAETEGAVAHAFTVNFRLSKAAPEVEAAQQELRAIIKLDDKKTREIEVRTQKAINAICDRGSDGGGFIAKTVLDRDDIRSIALGTGLWITGVNATRVAANHRFRTAMLGAPASELLVGERLTVSVRENAGRNFAVANFAQRSPKVLYAGGKEIPDSFGMRQPSFVHSDNARSCLTCECCVDKRQAEFYKFQGIKTIGDHRVASLEMKFGHCQTVHSVQGSQAPSVYLRRACIHKWFETQQYHGRGNLGRAMQDFARWLYTALSRAQAKVIVFDTLPAAAALTKQEKADIRAEMAALVA